MWACSSSHLLWGTLALTVPYPPWPLSWLPSPAFSIPFLFFIQLTLPPLELTLSHLPIILLWLPNSCIKPRIYISAHRTVSKSIHVALQCECAFRSPEDLVKMQILLQKNWVKLIRNNNDAKTAASGRILQVLIITIYSFFIERVILLVRSLKTKENSVIML